MDREASGRVAFITGAGSPSGIGYACAATLGREGASLAITSTTDRIHERAAELTALGYRAAGFVADLTDRAQVRTVVDTVTETFGSIDIVVNNAGMVQVGSHDGDDRRFVTLDDASWDRDIDRNLTTAFNVTRAVLAGMVDRGWGRVVMVSSVTGPIASDPGAAAYAAAKAGMDGLMRALSVEVGPDGVTVNSVAPGWIASGSQLPTEAEAGRHTPLRRSGTPAEVAEVVAFLAGERSRYVTGSVVVVDGGNTVQESKGP